MPTFSETAPADLCAVSRPSSLCIFAWLTIQTGALALSAMRIQLWEHAPLAGEFLAMETLLAIQILAAALLSPKLTDGWRAAGIAIASAWPFEVLAGFIAAFPVKTMLDASAFVSAWLVVLWIWRSCCGTERQKWAACALASTWAAAGPILIFIHAEYRVDTPQSPTPIPSALSGPLMSAIKLVNSHDSAEKWGCWEFLAAVALIGGVVFWIRQAIFPRRFTNYQTSH